MADAAMPDRFSLERRARARAELDWRAGQVSFVAFASALGVTLTPAQRVLARVAFDGAEPGECGPLARVLFGDVRRVPRSARALLCLVAGGRSGKSYVGALYSLWRAVVADLSGLAPGEVAVALLVAPSLPLARHTLRFAAGAVAGSPRLRGWLAADPTMDTVTLRRPDGHLVALECLPATRGGSALRARSLVSAVLDECAFFRSESYEVNDVELCRAVTPRVLAGGLVVLASTPWTEAGLLHTEFVRNSGHPRYGNQPQTSLAAHGPTLLLRDNDPSVVEVVERERKRDPENARREYDAEFLTAGAGQFFDSGAVRAALADGSEPGHGPIGIGADIGLVNDASACVVVRATGRASEPVYSVLAACELRPGSAPLRLSEVCATFADLARTHGGRQIMLDAHEREASRDHLEHEPDEHRRVTLLDAPAGSGGVETVYRHAAELLKAGRVRIPREHEALAAQLLEVTARAKPGGGVEIRSPRKRGPAGGTHGDLVSAFVLALWHAAEQREATGEVVRMARPETRWGSARAAGRGF